MPDFLDIQGKLADTNAAIARTRKAMAAHPSDFGLSLNMHSLEKRRRALEQAFLKAAELSQIDVCSYRITSADNHPIQAGFLGDVLRDFQTWVSIVYHAIKNGPQKTKSVPDDITQRTRYGFAYSFPGSVGIVLTLRNQQLLYGAELDEVLSDVLSMPCERKPSKILEYAHKLGPAPIRAMYNWVKHHADAHTGADIDWYRGTTVKQTLVLQHPEFVELRDALADTSEVEEKDYTIVAELIGADVATRMFHLRLPTGGEIRGKLSPNMQITENQTVSLPAPYKVSLRTRTTIQYSTEEEKVEHSLLNLQHTSGS